MRRIYGHKKQVLDNLILRLFPEALHYQTEEEIGSCEAGLADVTQLLSSTQENRKTLLEKLAANLDRFQYLQGDHVSIVDIALFSAVKQLNIQR